MVMYKILLKCLKNPFWIFQAFEIFTKEIFSKNSKTILACHIWHITWSCQVSCLGEQYNIMKSPQNHFCPFWSLSNFTLPNISKCSQTLWTCSNVLIIHLGQVAQVGEQVNLIKVPPKPSLSRIKFEQLYIVNFLILLSTFVSMFTWPNEATTPSGASRRIVLHV